jgi:rhamnose transport system permease protein
MTAAGHIETWRSEPRGQSFLFRYLRELSVTAAYALLLVVAFLQNREFFDRQFFNIWVAAAPVLVAAVGMTLVILAREIDISIGSQYAVCAVLAALLAKAGVPMPLVAAAAMLIGAALGAANGALVAVLGFPSIVVTLATMVIFRESLRWATQGLFVKDLPDHWQWFGLSQTAGEWALVAIALAVFALFAFAARWLAAVRAVYAVGSDREAARLAGLKPGRVAFWVFVLMGALTGLASLLNAVRSPDVDPKTGGGLELQVIAAVVVGGVSISGGRGTLLGSFIGVALMVTIGPALGFFHVPAEWVKAVQGLIILLAVASDALYRRTS